MVFRNFRLKKSTLTCDAEFCSSDADLIFESSDRVRFHIHRKNLEAHTGGFSAPEFEFNDEIIYLTEPAKVLRVIFQFVYPRRQPDLGSLGFGIVAAVSEAVEKYEVYAAMPLCKMRMSQFIADHAMDVLIYAVKHDYRSLVSEVAPHLVTKPLSSVLQKLPFECVIPWVKYHEAHSAAFETVLEYIRVQHQADTKKFACIKCSFTAFCELQRIKRFTKLEKILTALNDGKFGLKDCDGAYCRQLFRMAPSTVRSMLKTELGRIPKFSY